MHAGANVLLMAPQMQIANMVFAGTKSHGTAVQCSLVQRIYKSSAALFFPLRFSVFFLQPIQFKKNTGSRRHLDETVNFSGKSFCELVSFQEIFSEALRQQNKGISQNMSDMFTNA